MTAMKKAFVATATIATKVALDVAADKLTEYNKNRMAEKEKNEQTNAVNPDAQSEAQFRKDNNYHRMYVAHEHMITNPTDGANYHHMAISHANDMTSEESGTQQQIRNLPMLKYEKVKTTGGRDVIVHSEVYSDEERNAIHEHIHEGAFMGKINGVRVDTENLQTTKIGLNHEKHVSRTKEYRAELEANRIERQTKKQAELEPDLEP